MFVDQPEVVNTTPHEVANTTPSPSTQLPEKYAQILARKATVLEEGCTRKGEPKILKIPLNKRIVPFDARYRSYRLGERPVGSGEHKVIMLMGASGSGKSTLINAMVNYIIGVEWEDNFRFNMVDDKREGVSKSQAHSQTPFITLYTINKKEVHTLPYTLTIIDTPGFADTEGVKRDQEIIDLIQEFFLFSTHHKVDHINAIGFVVQAPLARLTVNQKYIFNSILSIFGKDISPNILIFSTFADGQLPPVITAITDAGIPHNGSILKFNNSALFAGGFDEVSKLFWKMGEDSMGTLLKDVLQLDPQSLSLTKEVLKERQLLQITVQGLKTQIQMAVCKTEELRKEHNACQQNQADIEANKDFTFEVEVPKLEKIDLSGTGYSATNCSKCQFTCHFHCTGVIAKTFPYFCRAIDLSGNCIACPNECRYSSHSRQNYRYKYSVEKITRTKNVIEQRYKDATGKKNTARVMITKLQDDCSEVNAVVYRLIARSCACIKRLNEIALIKNPLSIVDYVDLMIQTEENDAEPGWKTRVQTLQSIRENAEIISQIEAHSVSNRSSRTEWIHVRLRDIWSDIQQGISVNENLLAI